MAKEQIQKQEKGKVTREDEGVEDKDNVGGQIGPSIFVFSPTRRYLFVLFHLSYSALVQFTRFFVVFFLASFCSRRELMVYRRYIRRYGVLQSPQPERVFLQVTINKRAREVGWKCLMMHLRMFRALGFSRSVSSYAHETCAFFVFRFDPWLFLSHLLRFRSAPIRLLSS